MRLTARVALAAIPLAMAPAGCVTTDRAGVAGVSEGRREGCATAEVRLDFDFSGSSPARCVIEGARTFTLVIGPEHTPPINPSPWYAFRYQAAPGGAVNVRLSYLGAEHRYAPKLTREGAVTDLPVSVAADRRIATVTFPPGSGIVSAQPIIGADHYAAFSDRLTREFGGKRIELGRSLDGIPIEAMRFGDKSASRLIVILGRQHPPEVTGTYALEPFLQSLARALHADRRLRANYQILAVPLLNPDGVDRGHWRANRGGVDLNRDWGPFTQPETRAVHDWLAAHAAQTVPVAMIDFHSTNRNLFYVQGDEAPVANQRFLESWLAGKQGWFSGYQFMIEKRNANPGSHTAKNWFFGCYAIPAYTYEVGDDASQADVKGAAQNLARDFLLALPELRPAPALISQEAPQACVGLSTRSANRP